MHRLADEMCGREAPATWHRDASRDEVLRSLLEAVSSPVAALQRAQVLKLVTDKLSGAGEALCGKITDALMARRDDIRTAAGGIQATRIGRCMLEDFDWRAHVTIASDHASAMYKPALTLALTLSDKKKNMTVELGEAELDKLIHSLEAAEATLSEISS